MLVETVGLWLLRRRRSQAVLTGARLTFPRDRLRRRQVIGSVLFGLGWGIADACPGPIATQVGDGVPWALFRERRLPRAHRPGVTIRHRRRRTTVTPLPGAVRRRETAAFTAAARNGARPAVAGPRHVFPPSPAVLCPHEGRLMLSSTRSGRSLRYRVRALTALTGPSRSCARRAGPLRSCRAGRPGRPASVDAAPRTGRCRRLRRARRRHRSAGRENRARAVAWRCA